MLKITDAAGALLSRMIEEHLRERGDASGAVAARFIFERDNMIVRWDGPRPGDVTFLHDGRIVLVLDPEAADLLSDNTLVVHDTEDGPVLGLLF